MADPTAERASTTCAPSTACGWSTCLEGTSATVSYQHGVDELRTLLDTDPTVTAAVLIRPVSVQEIERTAREGLLMPPKSTFFTPKLRTGLVLRPLD